MSLVNLNLMRFITANEMNIFTRKMIVSINLETTTELSSDFDGFQLYEFIYTD